MSIEFRSDPISCSCDHGNLRSGRFSGLFSGRLTGRGALMIATHGRPDSVQLGPLRPGEVPGSSLSFFGEQELVVISAHKASPGAIDYYLGYVERGGEPGRWMGRGAEALGLAGSVSADSLRQLAEGCGADGKVLVEHCRANRVPCWDFTMSSPKSVSLLAALHPDGSVRQAVRAAHDNAVSQAVAYLESQGGFARRGPNGSEGHVAAELVVAGFVHHASRDADPQLHEHCLVMNVGRGADGAWSSIDSRTLYLHRKAASAVYKAELRRGLAALGAEWDELDSRGLSEVRGFSPKLLRHFSSRRRAIEARVEASGATGRAAGEAANLATRKTKVAVEFQALIARWRTEAADLGWGDSEIAAVMEAPATRDVVEPLDAASLVEKLLSAEGVTAESATFTRDDVIVEADRALRQGGDAAFLEAVADQVVADLRVVPLGVADRDGHVLGLSERAQPEHGDAVSSGPSKLPATYQPRYTTTEMLGVERSILGWAEAGRGSLPRLVQDPENLELAAELSEEQALMIRELLGSADALNLVVGAPGAGKTAALSAAVSAWREAGLVPIGAALSAQAAAELSRGAGIEARTIDSLLAALDDPVYGGLDSRSLLVVDEASMVDTRRLGRLVEHARRAGARVVLVGDDRQLPAIEAGGMFQALVSRHVPIRLTESRRQVHAWEREALRDLRLGHVETAVAAYVEHDRLRLAESSEELSGMVADTWWAAREQGEDVAVLAYSREAVNHLNATLRGRLVDAGFVGGAELVYAEQPARRLPERVFAVGDEVICLTNRRRIARDASGRGVMNGTRATVVGVDGTTRALGVVTQDGRVLSLPVAYVEASLDHSYATTVHKSQGLTTGNTATVGRALVVGAEAMSAEAALVAASRARDATEFFAVITREPVPTDEFSLPEPVAPELVMAESWARSEAGRAALDEARLAKRAEALALADGPELHAARLVLTDEIASASRSADARSARKVDPPHECSVEPAASQVDHGPADVTLAKRELRVVESAILAKRIGAARELSSPEARGGDVAERETPDGTAKDEAEEPQHAQRERTSYEFAMDYARRHWGRNPDVPVRRERHRPARRSNDRGISR